MSDKKLVWDLPLRLFHWLFGISILAAWATAELGEEQIHMWLGYLILSLLVFRVCWGLWGTTYAQFRHFYPRPKLILNYLKNLLNGRSTETMGHNPLGGLMVFLMLALVAIQAITGLFTEGEIWAGPYRSAVDKSLAKQLEAIHHSNFDYILLAIGLHIAAILFYLINKKQNLIWPMITGKKRADLAPEEQGIAHSKLWLATLTAIFVGGFIYWLVAVAPPPVIYEYYY